jgi:hypothetical protein
VLPRALISAATVPTASRTGITPSANAVGASAQAALCEHEQRDADHEHRPPAVRVAETPRRHEQQPQRERIARDDPLQLVRLSVQPPLDARQRDVDDRDVEQGHEPSGQNDAERHPAIRVGA